MSMSPEQAKKMADMTAFLDNYLPVQDTEICEMYRKKYETQLANGDLDIETKLQYAIHLTAWGLTNIQNIDDIKKAVVLFEEILKEGTKELKKESLFYLTVVEARQNNNAKAKKYVDAYLRLDPSCELAQELNNFLQKRCENGGIGMSRMALFGTVVGILGVVAAIGYALKI